MKLLKIFKRNQEVVNDTECNNFKVYRGNVKLNRENNIVIGAPGRGRNYHDWDKIYSCPRCHSRHVWMENDNKSHTCEDSHKPVRIRCLLCRKKTRYGEFYEVRKIWSNGKDNFRRPEDIIKGVT